MKKLDTSFITTQIGMPVKAGSLRHIQEAYTEPIAEMAKSLIGPNYNPNVTYILYGMFNTAGHPQYNITAGSVFRNGEVFLVDAVNVNVGGGTAVLSTIQTFATGQDADGVEFTDGVIRNVHQINKAQLTAGIAGTTNLGNYVDAQRINSNRPDVNLSAGNSGIGIGGSFPNFSISNLFTPNPPEILAHRQVYLGDINSTVSDGYTTLMSGGSSGFAAYVHNFPAPVPGNFTIILQCGNGGHDVTSNFDDNYMCSALLGFHDNTKFYFAVQTTATGQTQFLDVWYTCIKLP